MKNSAQNFFEFQQGQFSRGSDDDDDHFSFAPPPPEESNNGRGEIFTNNVREEIFTPNANWNVGGGAQKPMSLEHEEIFTPNANWNVGGGARKPISLEHEDKLHGQHHWPDHPDPPDDVLHPLTPDRPDFLLSDEPPDHEPPDLILPEDDHRQGPYSLEFATVQMETIEEEHSRNKESNGFNWNPWNIFGLGSAAQEVEKNDEPVRERKTLVKIQTPEEFLENDQSVSERISPRDRSGTNDGNAVRDGRRKDTGKDIRMKHRLTHRADAMVQKRKLKSNTFEMTHVPTAFGGVVVAKEKKLSRQKLRCSCLIQLLFGWQCSSSLWMPMFCLVSMLAMMCGLSGFLWMERDATVTEGAFGLTTQTKRAGPMNWHYFKKVQHFANAKVGHSGSSGDADLVWYQVEIIYYAKDGFLPNSFHTVDLEYQLPLARVNEIEKKLRNLDGWRKLCDEAPEKDRRFCSPGDSAAAVFFGTSTVTPDLAAQGVLASIEFDGSGPVPIDAVQQYLKDFHPTYLKRWFANSDRDSPIRSTFSFNLKDTSDSEWINFVEGELQSALEEVILEGEEEEGAFQSSGSAAEEDKSSTKVRVFCRAYNLKIDLFEEEVSDDQDWRAFAHIGAFVATFLMTRRILLACVALALSICTPLIATLLISPTVDGKAEYPVIAVASWFLVATTCADLAIACESGLELAKNCVLQQLPKCCRGKSCDRLRRFGLFLNAVPLPCLSSVGMLYLISYDDLPLVQEFATHTGCGLFCALVFSIFIYPPALEVGDMLHRESKENPFCLKCHTFMHGLVPFECGDPPLWWQQCGNCLSSVVQISQGNIARCICFVIIVVLILGASIPDASFTYAGEVPELFHQGHRLREGPNFLSQFGPYHMPLHSDEPSDPLSRTYTCKPDAHDTYQCGWFECEAHQQKAPQEGSCSCYTDTKNFTKSELSTCGAVARFSGLAAGAHDDFAKSTFWQWVETTLDISVQNVMRTADLIGHLKIEDWQTGFVSSQPQMVVKSSDANGQMQNFEDACLSIICYCGVQECSLEDAKEWKALGNVPSPLVRRLALLPRPTVSTAEIFVVFGLLTPDVIAEKYSSPEMTFGFFDIADPWTQRGMLAMCAGNSPKLRVVTSHCWIVDFEKWLRGRGEDFPVLSEDFHGIFQTFIGHVAAGSFQVTWPSSLNNYDFFWTDAQSRQMKGCYFSFEVDAPDLSDTEAVKAYKLVWDTYILQRKIMYPAIYSAWATSSIFSSRDASVVVRDAAWMTLTYAYLFCVGVTFLRTWSMGLSFIVFAILSMCFISLLCLAWLVDHHEFGTIELLCFVAFSVSLLPPLVRVTHQYSVARDGPGDKPQPASTQKFDVRMRTHSVVDSTLDGNGSFSVFHLLSSIPYAPELPTENAYLVDNRALQAGTTGLGYRLSPRLDDIDINSREFRRLAPWGSTVRGVPHGPNWLKVGDRFLPLRLRGIQVLELQEDEDEDMHNISSSFHHYRNAKWFWGQSKREKLSILKDAATEYFLHVIVPDDHPDVWEGCCQAERSRRLLSVLRRDGPVILGISLAGVIIGACMLPLRMEAIGYIGLASLGASLLLPIVALGFLPVLILLRLGPTRSRRRALYTFVQWMREGKPGAVKKSRAVSEGVLNYSSAGTKRADDTPDRHPGEIAASELGLPFSLALRKINHDDDPPPLEDASSNLIDDYYIRPLGSIAHEPALSPIRVATASKHGVCNVREPSREPSLPPITVAGSSHRGVGNIRRSNTSSRGRRFMNASGNRRETE